MLPPVAADDDGDGLRKVAALVPGEADLRCDKSLAKAGKKLGFVPAKLPEWAVPGVIGLMLGLAVGRSLEKVRNLAAVFEFRRGGGRFLPRRAVARLA